MAKSKTGDPIARLSIVQRWKWRTWERRVVDQFKREQVAALNVLRGKRVLGAVSGESGVLMAAIAFEGCWVTIRGTTDEARNAFLAMTRYNCRIDGIGRYRDAWWISVRPEPPDLAPVNRVVVLASHLTVSDNRT